jgi:transposase
METHPEETGRRRRTGQEVSRLVSEFEASGLRAGAFCRRHGLAASTLRRRLEKQPRREGKAEAGVRWVAVKVNAAPDPSSPGVGPSLEVRLAGGRHIGVAPSFDAATLSRLVRVLEALEPCSAWDRRRRSTWRRAPPTCARASTGCMGWLRDRFGLDPLSGHLVIFCNGERTRLKGLFWDGSGLWVCAKRLEKGRFSWPDPDASLVCVTLGQEEFSRLIGGLDLSQTRRKNWYRKAA